MKRKLMIFGFFCFISFSLACFVLVVKSALGAKRPKTIALTFDDGPRPLVLKELLPLLDYYDIPGTFFVAGRAVSENKELVRKMHEAGHEIENHSFDHENLKILYREKGAEAVRKTVRKCDKIIFEATGRKPKFFRPPFWAINDEIEKIIIAEGYEIMKLNDPDTNTMDYSDHSKKHPPEALVKRVKSQIASREKQGLYNHVLVFHELPITAEALKTLIPYFQSQGYKFIRLDAILPE